MSAQTPMLRQYFELKRQYPGTLMFFRMGDFYEMFFEDAITGARELEITLTARNKEKEQAVPMCGVPHHAAAGYIAKLVRKGFRVALCEQTEDPAQAKGLVKRDVVRVITPGTAFDPQLLESRETIYLAAVCGAGERAGAAFLDLSTGEFRSTQTEGPDCWQKIKSDLESYAPREILYPNSLELLVKNLLQEQPPHTLPLSPEQSAIRNPQSAIAMTGLDDWQWTAEGGEILLLDHLRAQTLAGYGLSGKNEAVRAAGACLRYAQETQKAAAAHITDLSYFEAQDHLILDGVTVRNLELTATQSGQRGRSLFDVIDHTVTGMGARTLKAWLLRPSIKRGEVEARLDAVNELRASQMKRDRARVLLKEIADLERLTGRLNMNNATPRDLLALARSLNQVPALRSNLNPAESSLLQILVESLDELPEARQLIEKAIDPDAPARLADGGVIRAGFNAEMDELRALSGDAKAIIAALEARERSRTNIQSLRVKFNQVFGYYIEISKTNLSRTPPDYERRQTLANAERFTTPELKELETKVLGAEERITQLEAGLFSEVCRALVAQTKRLQTTARALATLDALTGLAETATLYNYVRPQMHDGDEIAIQQGRHPVIETIGAAPFIPNDVYLNNSTDRLLIITGPNMAGKSSLLRQTALICLLAQVGSFVPAAGAKLPLLDRIWTRVGASDDLASGRSTFMVEMTETAAILHNATPRSLVLLDEIGRGTSTFDGLSIAWAVAEHLHDSPEHAAKTLFATHYHELTELAERLPGAQNYQVTALERDNEVVFLYKLERGRALKSYGIAVAQLAGLPPSVLARAREVLERLERYELDVFAENEAENPAETPENGSEKWHGLPNGKTGEPQSADAATPDQWQRRADETGLQTAANRARRRRIASQATLFDAVNQDALDEIRETDVNKLNEQELRALFAEVKRRIL
jgi:DNA mismatch repair protein MutS